MKLNISRDGLRAMLALCSSIDEARIKEHLRLFLAAVVPAAQGGDGWLAIHPDAPPVSVLGLPRVVSTKQPPADLLAMQASAADGVCYYTS